MKTFISLFCTVVYSIPLYSQQIQLHQQTQPPAEARFEVIQSQLAAKVTIKLDRFTGDSFLMVSKDEGSTGWQRIPRDDHSLQPATKEARRPNYQIFTSGLAVKFTYLMNVSSGATWQLIESHDESLKWSPIE